MMLYKAISSRIIKHIQAKIDSNNEHIKRFYNFQDRFGKYAESSGFIKIECMENLNKLYSRMLKVFKVC